MNKYIRRGIDSFFDKNYDNALLHFSSALKEESESKEARLGAILSDLALEKPDEAEALFEYYILSKDSGVKDSEDIVEEIINSVELTLEDIGNLFLENDIEARINAENGITYEDFSKIVKEKNDFKKVFEDIMFSTKVIIHNRDDFLDFLEQLIDNGYKEISLSYLESAVKMFPNDEKLLTLIRKV